MWYWSPENGLAKRINHRVLIEDTEFLHLDTRVTEDFINGIESSNGPTLSTGTHLFFNGLLIARRDPDGQIFAVIKGINLQVETMRPEGGK